jgi:hypothetical protein
MKGGGGKKDRMMDRKEGRSRQDARREGSDVSSTREDGMAKPNMRPQSESRASDVPASKHPLSSSRSY